MPEKKKSLRSRKEEKSRKEENRTLTPAGPLQKPAFLTKGRCIGVLNVGKCFCNKDFGPRRRAPRCRQSVARSRWDSHAWMAARFDGGALSLDAGLLALREVEKRRCAAVSRRTMAWHESRAP